MNSNSRTTVTDNPSKPELCKHCVEVQTPAAHEGSLSIHEAGSGVFMVTNGNYQAMFATTGQGVVLVDAPEPLVDGLEDAISSVTNEPLKTLIYSHGHSDHTGGAYRLFKPGLEIIAEERVAEFIREKNDGRRIAPTWTFNEATTLVRGNKTFSLRRDEFHSPEGDLIIHLPNERVLMAVDMIAPGWVPLLDFDITANMFVYLSAFDRILAYDFVAFVAGHTGDIARRHDVEMTKKYAFDVYETVKRIHGSINVAELLKQNRDNEQAGIRDLIEIVVKKSADEIKSRWLNGPMKGVDLWTESHCRAMVLYVRWSD